jgi:hypothetical protein
MEEIKQQQPVEPSFRRRQIPLWGWLAAIAYMVLVDNLMPSAYEEWALVAGWFALGTMCLVNFSSCGRYHCKITGPGFYGFGILAVLDTVGLINQPAWVIYSSLIAMLAVGFGLEYRYNSKSGSCYVACDPKEHYSNDEDL